MKKLVSMVLSVLMVMYLFQFNEALASANETGSLPYVDVGYEETLVIKTDGSLWKQSNGSEFKKIMDDVKFAKTTNGHVDAYGQVNLAIKKDGTLWMWGYNRYGALGNGTTKNSNEPIHIMDHVLYATTNGYFSAAIKEDGTLYMWGYNWYGNLGNGTNQDSLIPIKVMDNVRQIEIGGTVQATVGALQEDGSFWMWGYRQYTADHPKTAVLEPCKIMDNVMQISFGSGYYMLKNDGSLWGMQCTIGGWGDLFLDEKRHMTSTPKRLMSYNDIKYINAGSGHLGILREDNSLWSIGSNSAGQLGIGTNEESAIPTKVLDDVKTFSYGWFQSGAITNNDQLWMWGRDVNSNIPIKIMNLNVGLVIEGENTVQNNRETILKVTRYDENGNIAPEGGISWSCSDESVAQITPWGNNVTIKGLKSGKATITATHAESGQKADFEIEVVSYVMTLAGGYTAMLDEELEINYAIKQGEEYVHNDLDIKWEIESKDSNNAVKIISDKDNAYTRALTIKGINEGECELVAKVDGAELGRTKIEVLGNLADTIEQEAVLRAKILQDNSQYKYYKNNFTDLPEMFTKDMNKTPAVLYNAINDVFKSPTDRTNFYEIVLLDILTDGESTKLLGELGNIVDNKIVQHATKQIGNLDFDTNTSSADTTVKKMFDELLDEADDVGKVKVGDVLDGLYTGKKMVDTYIDTVASTYSLALVSNSQIKVLEDIKNNTTNSNLKEACDNVLDMYYKSSKVGVSYAAQLGMVESGYDGLEFATGQLIDTVCKLNWVSALYKGAFDVGTTVSTLAYNADDLSAQTLTLVAYAEIGDCLKEAVTKAESNFNSKEDLASASKFMALADTYKVCLLKGCDSSYKLVETTKATEKTSKTFETAVFGVLGLTKDAITGLIDLFNDSKDYDHTMKTITDIKKNIGMADFYSTEGTDVVKYLREVKSTTPSEWVKPEIEKAKNYGFLPDYMQNNYQNNITRAEFCTILTWMIEEKTGKGIGQLIEEKGTPIKSPFEDTYYEYADYMCKLGIVNGVSATEFNPLGEITREQAATMLMRTADVLGYDTSYNTSVESGVSSWATEGVGFVTENGIMNGTGNGFEPQGKYTKEQAIATFVRMYDNLK